VNVWVAYSWTGGVSTDRRWRDLRTMLSKVAKEARGRAARLKEASVEVEDEPGAGSALESGRRRKSAGGNLPSIRIARLRATVGTFVWSSISARIREADLVIVDLAPPETKGVSANVWLELGLALGCLPAERVCVLHSDADGFRDLPSDLHGLMLGHLPPGGAAADRGLRARLVSTLVGLLLARTTGAVD
jgi:hypothetical protein